MSNWSPYEVLPEVLVEDEKRKDQQIVEMRDRIQRLESQLLSTRQPQGLSGISIGGFELTTNVLMFGAIIGLVVYVLTSKK